MTEDRTDVLGRRIGAALVDILLLTVLFVVVAVVAGQTETSGSSASARLGTGATVAFAVLGLLYYGLAEALSGQTLGKRLLGIRVARLDGTPAGVGAIAIRTVLRIVDNLPLAYLLGFVVVLVTGQRRQRVGDLAAGTTVVSAR